jgi:hypothetical protein
MPGLTGLARGSIATVDRRSSTSTLFLPWRSKRFAENHLLLRDTGAQRAMSSLMVHIKRVPHYLWLDMSARLWRERPTLSSLKPV